MCTINPPIKMLNLLPSELIGEITKHMNTSLDLLSYKLINKEICKIIKNFGIMKLKIFELLQNPKHKELCVNTNCYYDTIDVFIDKYRQYEGRYIHYHQNAMNFDNVYFNTKQYNAFSPYCHYCFTQHILRSGIEEQRIKDLSCEGFVDVEILNY